MAKQYILEGEWTGYTSAQRRVVHCEVINQTYYNKLAILHAIVYSDGTSLLISARKKLPRQKVIEKLAYKSLIRDAAELGKACVHIEELPD